MSLGIQAGEKVYQDFTFKTTNQGGHSSAPVRVNAISQLAAGLAKLGAYQFPLRLNPTTRAYFTKQAELAKSPQVAADMRAIVANPNDAEAAGRLWTANPGWNGMMRTTCVATMINGGHAQNALPQRAIANVNCRMAPTSTAEAVRATLARVVAETRDRHHLHQCAARGVSEVGPPDRTGAARRDDRADAEAVGRHSRDPDDVHRCHRRTLPARRRHSDVRRERDLLDPPARRTRTASTSGSASSRCWTGAGSFTKW